MDCINKELREPTVSENDSPYLSFPLQIILIEACVVEIQWLHMRIEYSAWYLY